MPHFARLLRELSMNTPKIPETLLWLLRHPEPETVRGRCYGRLDVSLSTEGTGSARLIAERLARITFHAIYASPLQRCAQAAEILAEGRSCPVERVESLREIDFGEWEGRSYDEIAALYPHLYLEWMERPTEIRFPKGECFRQMRSRVLAAAQRLVSLHAGQSVALVTHGGVIRIILADVLRMIPADIFRIGQAYGAINLIRYVGQLPTVELMNWSMIQPLLAAPRRPG